MTDTEITALLGAGAGAGGATTLALKRRAHKEHIEDTIERLFSTASEERKAVERAHLHHRHKWWHRRKP